jgi:hypothetical protein
MTNSEPTADELLEIKLALLGIGIWSGKEYNKRFGYTEADPGDYAIVTLESKDGNGTFYFGHPLTNLFNSKRAAMDAAMEAVMRGKKRYVDD